MRPSLTIIIAKHGSSIAPACKSACCASEALQPAVDSLYRLSHMAGALTVHSHCSLCCAAYSQGCSVQSRVQRTVKGAAYSQECSMSCTKLHM